MTDFGSGVTQTRFQNNIQSLFNRVRLLYGSTPIEDIINYNVIVRALTEWTGTNQTNTMDQSTIADGIGGVVVASDNPINPAVDPLRFGLVNVRQAYIQGIDRFQNTAGTGTTSNFISGRSNGTVPNAACRRRYQVSFALGLFTQDKLVIKIN